MAYRAARARRNRAEDSPSRHSPFRTTRGRVPSAAAGEQLLQHRRPHLLLLVPSRMDMSFKDARRLWSGIRHKEKLVNKKRRWLMQFSLLDTNEVRLKKVKKWSLSNMFLPESFVRDEVSSRVVKLYVERNYTTLCCTEESLLSFHNFMVVSDLYILQSFFLEPSILMKFHTALDLLSNNALGILANLVNEGKISFDRTRTRIKEIIKSRIPNILSETKVGALLVTLKQLYENLRNLEKYKEKQTSLMTHGCSSILPSIYKALELLESMPIFALSALNRKLTGKMTTPRFPPSKIGYNKKEFVNRIRRRFQKLILTLNKESSMPEGIVKAMSIIHLYFKYKTKCSETFTEKVLYVSIETIILQNAILKALWSIPTVTPSQIETLLTIMVVKLGDDSSRFLNDLRQYLIQYLFECDKIEIPNDVSQVLAILNQSSCSQPQICSKEKIDVEIESVLNVSVELNQIITHLVSCVCIDEKDAEDLESDKDTNDFELISNDYCSNPVNYRHQQKNGFSINDDLESIGDSMPPTSDSCSDVLLSEATKNINHGFVKKLKKDEDYIDDFISHCNESKETSRRNTQASKDCSVIAIKALCDETSLVSYRLIGHMLNSLLPVEGVDVVDETRHHVIGEASYLTTSQDMKDVLHASEEKVGLRTLMHSTKDLLSFMPNRCTQILEKFVKQH